MSIWWRAYAVSDRPHGFPRQPAATIQTTARFSAGVKARGFQTFEGVQMRVARARPAVAARRASSKRPRIPPSRIYFQVQKYLGPGQGVSPEVLAIAADGVAPAARLKFPRLSAILGCVPGRSGGICGGRANCYLRRLRKRRVRRFTPRPGQPGLEADPLSRPC